MNELKIELKGKHKLESSFTTPYLKALKDKWYYVDKVSDASIGTKKVDVYIGTDKWFYIAEIKVIQWNKFPIKRLRENQLKALRTNLNTVWIPIVIIYSKSYNKYKIIPFDWIKDIEYEDSIELNFTKD